MIDTKTPIIGVVFTENQKLNFYLDDFIVNLMKTEPSEIQLDGQFIYGHTLGDFINNRIAIYKGDHKIVFNSMYRFETYAYIVTKSHYLETTFDYIQCIGGTLNNLFFCSSLDIDPIEHTLSTKDDSQKYSFSIDNCNCSLQIGSQIKSDIGLQKNTISNDSIYLKLKFESPQPLNKSFEYIKKLKNMLSFMTFRTNVGFDEIYLGCTNPCSSEMQLFLKEDTSYTKKSIVQNITFHDLGNSVGTLASTIFNDQNKDFFPNLDFFPKSDRDVAYISNIKIRLIISALESELSNHNSPKSKSKKDKALQDLKEQVKQLIKKHEEENHTLSKDTYDTIFSTIRYWSRPAKERLCDLYQDHIDAMQILAAYTLRHGKSISDKDIECLVKYRNEITHGTPVNTITPQVTTTAFILQGLVYCCILKRIGINKDTIISLCKSGKILS